MSVARFIASQRTEHSVPRAVACRALDVSESWFYKWNDRGPTPRQRREQQVSDNTVAQIMAENDWVARKVKHRRSLTKPGKRPVAPDLVRRQFTAIAQDVLWCGDVTEIPTDEGKLYL